MIKRQCDNEEVPSCFIIGKMKSCFIRQQTNGDPKRGYSPVCPIANAWDQISIGCHNLKNRKLKYY
jgi:hypothetical protein